MTTIPMMNCGALGINTTHLNDMCVVYATHCVVYGEMGMRTLPVGSVGNLRLEELGSVAYRNADMCS